MTKGRPKKNNIVHKIFKVEINKAEKEYIREQISRHVKEDHWHWNWYDFFGAVTAAFFVCCGIFVLYYFNQYPSEYVTPSFVLLYLLALIGVLASGVFAIWLLIKGVEE